MSNWKRPEVPVTLAFLRQHPDYIEWTLLAGSIKSLEFHRKIRNYVCPRVPAKDHFRADFQNPEFYIAYCEVALYWAQFDYLPKLPRDFELGIIPFEQLLLEKVAKGKLAQQRAVNILEEVKLDLEVVFHKAQYDAFADSDLFKEWHKTRVEADLQKQIAAPGLTPMTIEIAMERVQKAKSEVQRNEKPIKFGMAAMPKGRSTPKPIPSGFFELDRAMGGGFPVGSVTMIGGATGSGKTVLASTLLLHFAQQRRSTMLVTTERPPADYICRMASNFLNVDVSRLRLDASDLTSEAPAAEERPFPGWVYSDPNYSSKMAEFVSVMENVAFVNWAENTGHTIVKDFDALFHEMEQSSASVVIFDWLGGGLAGREKGQEIREVYLKAIRTLTEHARSKQRAIIVFAQLDKKEMKRNPKEPHHTMLTESKNMVDEVNVFIGISDILIQTKNGPERAPTQYLNVTKATLGPQGSCPVLADFEFQRFREARKPGRLAPS